MDATESAELKERIERVGRIVSDHFDLSDRRGLEYATDFAEILLGDKFKEFAATEHGATIRT